MLQKAQYAELYDIAGESVHHGTFNAVLYGIGELDLHHLTSGAMC